MFLFFKLKTAYEMRISDWSSDVCSSDLDARAGDPPRHDPHCHRGRQHAVLGDDDEPAAAAPRRELRREIGRASCRGKSVSVRVDLGGRRIMKKKTDIRNTTQ